MRLDVTTEEAAELLGVLESTLGDLSYEIAASDNAGYRAGLVARRDRLAAVRDQLRSVASDEGAPSSP